jgi:hypothetical protein
VEFLDGVEFVPSIAVAEQPAVAEEQRQGDGILSHVLNRTFSL